MVLWVSPPGGREAGVGSAIKQFFKANYRVLPVRKLVIMGCEQAGSRWQFDDVVYHDRVCKLKEHSLSRSFRSSEELLYTRLPSSTQRTWTLNWFNMCDITDCVQVEITLNTSPKGNNTHCISRTAFCRREKRATRERESVYRIHMQSCAENI